MARPVIVLVTMASMSRRRKPGLGHRLRRDPLQQGERVALIGLGALFPGVRPQVPVLGLDRVAPLDARVGVERFEAGVLRIELVRALGDLLLPVHVLGHGRGDGGDLHVDCGCGGATGGQQLRMRRHEGVPWLPVYTLRTLHQRVEIRPKATVIYAG